MKPKDWWFELSVVWFFVVLAAFALIVVGGLKG
jgi:hypothetical protein